MTENIIHESRAFDPHWEVRDHFENAIGWFLISADAEAFIRGLDLTDDSGYTMHAVRKIVTEDTNDY